MSSLTGTIVIAPIVPPDSVDTYPTHYANYGAGGLFNVNLISDRDAISVERKVVGMLCSVVEDSNMYQWDGTTWNIFSAGISGSGFAGPSGYSGYSGLSGFSGTQGTSGSNGTSGFSGYSGSNGFSGFSGYSGIPGISGYSGFSGFSGVNGTIGQSGFSGYSGSNGVSGFSGYSGSNGANGTSGFSGYSGNNGSIGISGYSGYSGNTGLSGFSGFSGIDGSSVPISATVAAAGQIFIGTGSGMMLNTLIEGSNITITNGPGTITISSTSSSSGSGGSGYSGYSGFSGSNGNDGVSGFSGYSGSNGSIGISGFSGFSGSNGSNGTSGFSGYSGSNGSTGISGFSGYSGTNGSQGISGFSGYSGYSGSNGSNGTSGFSGFSGSNGSTGTSGFSGYSGSNGTAGVSGFSGYSGYSGSNGSTGISGFSGYSGINGISGFSGFSGSTTSISATNASQGQIYIGTGSAMVLNTLTQGSNIVITNGPGTITISSTATISGSSGASGYSGYSGFSGSNGTNGVSGFSGYSGYSGSNGATGTSGFSGYSGSNGSTGTSGFSGFSGYSGSNGSAGTSGFSGYSGSNGSAGTSGFSGYSGSNGSVGTSGFSGYSGSNGSAGTSGFSGYSGSNGATGTSGFSGYSGAGTSGFSGYSGAAGGGITLSTGQVGFGSGTNAISGSSFFTTNGLSSVSLISTTNDSNVIINSATGFPAVVNFMVNSVSKYQIRGSTTNFVLNDSANNLNFLTYTPGASTAASVAIIGKLLSQASSTSQAGINISPGTAPSSPTNGDLWATSSGLFARINSTTYTLTATGFAGSIAANQIAYGSSTNTLAGTAALTFDGSAQIALGQSGPKVYIQSAANNNNIQFWKDTTPSAAVSVGNGLPGGSNTTDLLFCTYSPPWTERARILNGGQFLVGATTNGAGSEAFQVGTTSGFYGSTYIRASHIVVNVSSNTCATQYWSNTTPSFACSIGLATPGVSTGNDLRFCTYSGSSYIERMRLLNGGSFIIGGTTTGTGSEAFQAATTAGFYGTTKFWAQPIVVNVSSNTCATQYWSDSTPTTAVSIGLATPGSSTGSDLRLCTFASSAWTERARIINSTGNMLIGTTTDDATNLLQVHGSIRAWSAGSATNVSLTVDAYSNSSSQIQWSILNTVGMTMFYNTVNNQFALEDVANGYNVFLYTPAASSSANLSFNSKLTTSATTTTRSGFNLAPGTAPTSPVNGDLWSTSLGVYSRVNGATVGPFIDATSVPAYSGSVNASLNITKLPIVTSGNQYGVFSSMTHSSSVSGAGTSCYGIGSYANTGVDALAEAAGVITGVPAATSSTPGTAGYITRAQGVRITPSILSANSASIYIDKPTDTATTSLSGHWSIYNGANSDNFLGTGQTFIGNNAIITNGKLQCATVGSGIQIAEGNNATMGVVTLSSGIGSVNSNIVTSRSRILITAQSLGTITTPASYAVSNLAAGISFNIISSQSNDTSTVFWMILEPI